MTPTAEMLAQHLSPAVVNHSHHTHPGSCTGYPRLPVLDDLTLLSAAYAAHRHDKLAIS